ncbi:hypothetical protein AB0K23_31945, partial [Streptomyces sp. NPDC049602]
MTVVLVTGGVWWAGDGEPADPPLAAGPAAHGRLDQLVSLGKDLPVTWVVDPDLLASVDVGPSVPGQYAPAPSPEISESPIVTSPV